MKCSYKIGLINLRDCGQETRQSCVTCNRPICSKHGVNSNQGPLCKECYAQQNPHANKSNAWQSYRRNRFYGGYHYAPLYFGHRGTYGNEDYRYFDPAVATDPNYFTGNQDTDNDIEDNDDMDASDFHDS